MTRIGPSRSYTGPGNVAVSPHHLATAAALEVMAAGGTAADGAIAANAVLGMVLPDTCGIGGDLFAMIHTPGVDRPAVLNASGRAGSGVDAAAMRAAGRDRIERTDPEAVTVPGCVDGWIALSDRFGALPLADVLAAAIRHGRDGFLVSRELSAALHHAEATLAAHSEHLYPGGSAPDPMATITRPDLAATLEAIGSESRPAFYEGAVAAAVSEATGGILTPDDLAANRPDWVAPARLDVFGHTAWTVPPNSQGYLTLATCWILEQLGPPADPDDPAFHHAVIEAYRAMAWERDDLVTDPDHAPHDAAWLLDPERLAPRVERISPDSAASWPEGGDAPGGTAYLCTVDANGMGVSFIQSNFTGLGGLIVPEGSGFLLHNRGAGFTVTEGHPNEIATGKRPLHTLAPTLWSADGELRMVLGTRGGHQQPQYLAQMAALLLHAGMEPSEAQGVARWHIDAPGGVDDSVVSVEARMPEGVVSGLAGRGHGVVTGPPSAPGWGPVSVITVDGPTRRAAADPRVSTAAADGDG
jgi:gamma-glutamyltranspeptidase/glutathione hydrolase